jgi:hypothetical protein
MAYCTWSSDRSVSTVETRLAAVSKTMQLDYTGKYILLTASYNLDNPDGVVGSLAAQVGSLKPVKIWCYKTWRDYYRHVFSLGANPTKLP